MNTGVIKICFLDGVFIGIYVTIDSETPGFASKYVVKSMS